MPTLKTISSYDDPEDTMTVNYSSYELLDNDNERIYRLAMGEPSPEDATFMRSLNSWLFVGVMVEKAYKLGQMNPNTPLTIVDEVDED